MPNQLIPDSKERLYHATYTRKDAGIIKSFLGEGVRPNVSSGNGQGNGFYVWTTEEKALAHLAWLNNESGFNDWFPTIIVLDEEINPKDWDLDYEVNSRLILAFLNGYWKLFRQIPDDAIEINGKYLAVSKCKNNKSLFSKNNNIVFHFSNNSRKCIAINSDDGNLYYGELLGKIFDYLQIQFPKQTEEYEKAVFEKLAKKGMGLKYVGKTPLKAHEIRIYADKKWLKGSKAIEFFEKNPTI